MGLEDLTAGEEGAEKGRSRGPEEAGAGVPSQPRRGPAASPAPGGLARPGGSAAAPARSPAGPPSPGPAGRAQAAGGTGVRLSAWRSGPELLGHASFLLLPRQNAAAKLGPRVFPSEITASAARKVVAAVGFYS